ncbi:MAG: hypothetical protein Q9190_005833 [Brigantiaea leucoxantha]
MKLNGLNPPGSFGGGMRGSLPLVTPSATVLVESPFFLSPETNVLKEARPSPRRNRLSGVTLTFPLTKLPAELQLRVLWHCLVSSLPILNAGVPKDEHVHLAVGEIPGQHRINPRIIFTCKAYYKEGSKLLYANNTFLYTSERPPQKWKGGKKILRSAIKKLTIRSVCDQDYDLPQRAAEISMYWLQLFKNVKMLQIDFCSVVMGYERFWDEDEDKFSLFLEFIDYVIVQNMKSNATVNGLKQVVLSGLPENDLGLFLVRSFSLLMRKDGRIGIGTGSHGKRYQKTWEMANPSAAPDSSRLVPREPEIVWIGRNDVPELIKRAASDECSRWLIEDFDLVSGAAM